MGSLKSTSKPPNAKVRNESLRIGKSEVEEIAAMISIKKQEDLSTQLGYRVIESRR